MKKKHIEVLKEKLNLLNLSVDWVKRSYDQCLQIGVKKDYSMEEFDKFENLTSRYARTTDMLVNQALRGLDIVELTDSGTIIDIMNRAEKRGIVESAETLHELKELRNEIAHEYQIEQIERFFEEVMASTPILLSIINNLQTYCERYIQPER